MYYDWLDIVSSKEVPKAPTHLLTKYKIIIIIHKFDWQMTKNQHESMALRQRSIRMMKIVQDLEVLVLATL